jgi:SAM-dependent methyltransferase
MPLATNLRQWRHLQKHAEVVNLSARQSSDARCSAAAQTDAEFARNWGDFAPVAELYHNWPSYSDFAIGTLIDGVGVHQDSVTVDMGAGAGTLTSILQAKGLGGLAVEPDDAMREQGIKLCGTRSFAWSKGTAEQSGLPLRCANWVVMGNAFHWVDTTKSLAEIHRLLKDDGNLSVVWVLRDSTRDQLLQEIENIIDIEAGKIRRTQEQVYSSMDALEDALATSTLFVNSFYVEVSHVEVLTPERYRRAWRTVTDIPSQVGARDWKRILARIDALTARRDDIAMHMRTYAWTARKQ